MHKSRSVLDDKSLLGDQVFQIMHYEGGELVICVKLLLDHTIVHQHLVFDEITDLLAHEVK